MIFLVGLLVVLGLIFSGGASETDVWTLESPLNLITTGNTFRSGEKYSWKRSVKGFEEFRLAVWHSSIRGRLGAMSDFTLLRAVEKYSKKSRLTNNIFIIPPKDILQVEELEAKYPNLVPLSYDELRQYSYPLFYFARTQTNKVQGIIVTNELDKTWVDLLLKKIPLNTPFRYEKGELQVLKLPEEILVASK